MRARLAAAWRYARLRIRWRSLIPVILFGLSILFTVHYVNTANHKFCQVIRAATATPVQKPANPAANPSREQAFEWYQRYRDLGRSLGC
jgi:hypothetical protein